MPATSLQDLYFQKLQMMLDAERQGLDAMPALVERVQNPRLRDALEQHHQQSQEHVRRLEQLFKAQGQDAEEMDCPSMTALIEEAQTTLPEIEDEDTADAFIIACVQGIEHHEIASYGTARTWASQLGFREAAEMLQRTLDEEAQADQMLSSIAEQSVNEQASRGSDREVALGGRGGTADQLQSGDGGRSTGATRRTDLDADTR